MYENKEAVHERGTHRKHPSSSCLWNRPFFGLFLSPGFFYFRIFEFSYVFSYRTTNLTLLNLTLLLTAAENSSQCSQVQYRQQTTDPRGGYKTPGSSRIVSFAGVDFSAFMMLYTAVLHWYQVPDRRRRGFILGTWTTVEWHNIPISRQRKIRTQRNRFFPP